MASLVRSIILLFPASRGASLLFAALMFLALLPYSSASAQNDIVSVMGFGAVADGITDNTAAFQAALTEACSFNAATVTVPPSGTSVYRINSTVKLPCHNLAISGQNARIACYAITSCFQYVSVSSVFPRMCQFLDCNFTCTPLVLSVRILSLALTGDSATRPCRMLVSL